MASAVAKWHIRRAVGPYTPEEMPMSSYAVRPVIACHVCNKIIDAEAVVCTGCGVMQPAARLLGSDKRILPVFLLAVFLGVFGVHRFYVGKIGTGLLQLLTVGGLGIWMLVDVILIVTGNFRDEEGATISEWT